MRFASDLWLRRVHKFLGANVSLENQLFAIGMIGRIAEVNLMRHGLDIACDWKSYDLIFSSKLDLARVLGIVRLK